MRAVALLGSCGAALLAAAALSRDAIEPPAAAGEQSLAEASAMRCNDRNAVGTGLRGDYFAVAAQRGEKLFSRVDSTVEFDTPPFAPAGRPRSVRWHGWIKAPLSGRYRFHGGPHATITVGGLPVAGGSADADASLELTAGSLYPLVMEVDLIAPGPVRLEWTAPHGARYVVPRALLFLPMEAS